MASVIRRFVGQSLSISARSRQNFMVRSSVFYLTNGFERQCSSSPEKSGKARPKPETVSINFFDRDGDTITVKAKVGDSLLDVAKDNDIDLEGACEGTLSCSTCHLIFKPEEMEKLNLEEPTDEELDMLDLAYGLTDTSRLGCQIDVTKSFEGVTLTIPKAHRDIRNL